MIDLSEYPNHYFHFSDKQTFQIFKLVLPIIQCLSIRCRDLDFCLILLILNLFKLAERCLGKLCLLGYKILKRSSGTNLAKPRYYVTRINGGD